ncbi:MAG: TPM domain-containing protein, partial [Candidatus Omnitrophica bacterium]|nr:TPM domain-containing protein [Candidatus Omnitrophota bacterium]
MGRKALTGKMVLLLLVVLLLSQTVHAQSTCDVLVVDEAGVFGDGLGDVEAAVNKLVLLGVDVRVRTIQTFGSVGTLDNYEKQVEQQCASWRATDGGRKNNLLVAMIAVDDRRTAVYYGQEWERTLDGQWERIIADRMNPRFRDSDFAGGFENGLGEIGRLIDLQLHPPTQAPASAPPSVVVVQPERPPSPPPDLSGLWKVLGLVVVLAVLAVVGYYTYLFVTTYLAEQTKRRAAQQKARIAKKAAASRITDWDSQDVEVAVANLDGQVVKDEVQELRDDLARAQGLYDRAAMAYADMDSTAGDPDQPGLTPNEYDIIAGEFEQVLRQLRDANIILKEVGRQIEAMRNSITWAPEAIEMASQAFFRATGQVAEITEKGFETTEAGEMLRLASDSLVQAQDALKAKRFKVVWGQVEISEAQARQAAKQAEALPGIQQAVEQLVTELAARIEEIKAMIEAGAVVFAELSATYAESCWKSFRGNGTEAENRLNWSAKAWRVARGCSTMEEQQWQKAKDMTTKANAWLDQAENLMRSIFTLENNLEAAKQDADEEIVAAQADIDVAWEYIERYDGDIRESLEDDLRQAQETLGQADAELEKTKPDYLKVVKLARQANKSADQILVKARSEHEAAERLRQKAAGALRDAKAVVSQAAEYIEDRSYDVGRTAESQLGDAQEFLKKARSARTLESQIRHAEKAEEYADKAYSRAQSDVDDAEEARRPTYSSTDYSGWGSSSSIPWSSDDDGDDGGGGSIDWGSSDDGGGGSSSWCSSGGGGGGS